MTTVVAQGVGMGVGIELGGCSDIGDGTEGDRSGDGGEHRDRAGRVFRHDGTEGDRRMGVSTEIELGGCSDMMAQRVIEGWESAQK